MPTERSTSMRQAALGTALVFTASGALLGTWVSRVPAIVSRHDLSPGELGRALLALGVGSLLSMPLTGHVCRRVGSRAWVAFTSVVAAAVLSCVGLATDQVQLAAALFGLGMVYGSWDVAMNVQGSAVDQRAGREWMPRYHACWSLGSIIGAAIGAAAARGDVAIGLHFTVAAWCATAAALIGLLRYVDERAPTVAGSSGTGPPITGPPVTETVMKTELPAPGLTAADRDRGRQQVPQQLRHPGRTPEPPVPNGHGAPQQPDGPPTGEPSPAERPAGQPATTGASPGWRSLVGNRALLLIGLLTLCATIIEGAADDWLALYLHTGRGLSEASAALGYTAFATAMTVVRFAGTPAAEWLGRAGAVRAGGVLGIAGVLITVLSPWVPGTFAGALLWGAGVCLVFPAAVSAAGETDRPAEAIALVTSIGYGSILIGPPLIGALAEVIGMDTALLTLAALAAGVAVLAPAVQQPPKPTTATPQPVAPQPVAPQFLAPQFLAPQDIAQQDIAPRDIAPRDIAPPLDVPSRDGRNDSRDGGQSGSASIAR